MLINVKMTTHVGILIFMSMFILGNFGQRYFHAEQFTHFDIWLLPSRPMQPIVHMYFKRLHASIALLYHVFLFANTSCSDKLG